MKKIILLFVFLIPLLVNAQNHRIDEIACCDGSVSAQFSGGTKEYSKFLKTNLKYPEKAFKNNVEGIVYVRLMIEKDGRVNKDCVKVSRSVDRELDAEAVRVVRLSPNWTPAIQNEITIRQTRRVPVKFKISEYIKSKK